MKFVLLIGLLVGGQLEPVPELSGASFATLEACEDVKAHSAVIASYPGYVMWCVGVR